MSRDRIRVESEGFGLGTMIAVALSWAENHSIGWAIVHGMLSWCYVIYRAILWAQHQ